MKNVKNLNENCNLLNDKMELESKLKENCKAVADSCSTRAEFKENYAFFYNYSKLNGFYEEICKNLSNSKKKKDKLKKITISEMYTKEECYQESLNYDTRLEFSKHAKTYFRCAEINQWLNDFPHLRTKNSPIKTRYTKFECYTESLKYTTKRAFQKNSRIYYSCSVLNGWINEFKHLSTVYISKNVNNNYTKTECQISAQNYSTRSEFAAKAKKYYEAAFLNKWLTDICSHMKNEPTNDKVFWTKENCNTEALKYKTRKEFECGNGFAYHQAQQKGWLDIICSHMDIETKSEFWTKQRCKIEAAKYIKKSHFSLYSEMAYYVANKFGWLDDICSHMLGDDENRYLKLTDEEIKKNTCFNEALKYSSMREFYEKSPEIFEICRTENLFNDACKHMPTCTLPAGYWTKERCESEAKKYTTITEFRKKSKTAYNKILEFNWIELDKHLR